MEFGFSLPSRGQAATMQNMRLLAQHVESLGLDSVWVSDHIIVPRQIDSFYPYDPDGRFPSAPDQDYYEPLTTLAFLAACTTRVQLGTSVLILPYRNALLTAKVVSTLDALCGGRVILGVGVGWMEEEFVALGLDTFHQRGAVTDEYIRAFRTLWTSDQPSFEGKHVRFTDIGFAPKPRESRLSFTIFSSSARDSLCNGRLARSNAIVSGPVTGFSFIWSTRHTSSPSVLPCFSVSSMVPRGYGFESPAQPSMNIACTLGCCFSTKACAKPA